MKKKYNRFNKAEIEFLSRDLPESFVVGNNKSCPNIVDVLVLSTKKQKKIGSFW